MFDAIEAELAAAVAQSAILFEPHEPPPDLLATTITIHDARNIVQDPAAPAPVSDSIWSSLLRMAQGDPRRWDRILLWIMLPRLRGIASRLSQTWRVDIQDIRSEVVLGFIETIHQVGPDQDHLGARLWWNTYRLARRRYWQATREMPSAEIEPLTTRQATADYANSRATATAYSARIDASRCDRQAVEGERLGSVASRLGLRTVIRGSRPSGGKGTMPLPTRRHDPRRPPTVGRYRRRIKYSRGNDPDGIA